jgi:ABC-2 type transport system ATP-binding protein
VPEGAGEAAVEDAIVVSGLVRRFGDSAAVDGLSLSVKRGEVLGLLGHNGAGKTTTIRLLNGVLSRHGGVVTVLGLDPEHDGDAVRARTGVLTESPAVDERFSARYLLELHARLHLMDRAVSRARIDELLAELDLLDVADERVASFSKGMKQKLAVVRSLLHDPEVLYLDEPTSGLDPVASRKLVETVRKLAHERGRAVVFCTHRLLEAEDICDRVAILSRGKLVALGTPAELAGTLAPASAPLIIEVNEDERARLLSLDGLQASERADGAILVHDLKRADVPALIERLVSEGFHLYGVSAHRARLEDAYLALAELAEKEEGQ